MFYANYIIIVSSSNLALFGHSRPYLVRWISKRYLEKCLYYRGLFFMKCTLFAGAHKPKTSIKWGSGIPYMEIVSP